MATASVTNVLVNAATITHTEHNTNYSDLVTFLNDDVVHRDGSKAMTGNLDLGSSEITQAAWQTPTLLNSWVNFGSGEQTARYRIDTNGVVWIEGVIKDGTEATTTQIFLLPSGYRPSSNHIFLAATSPDVSCAMKVSTSGYVILRGADVSNTYVAFRTYFRP